MKQQPLRTRGSISHSAQGGIRSDNETMKQLEPIPQCVDCLMSLARDVTALAGSTNSEIVEKVDRISREIIEEYSNHQCNSP